MSYSAKALFSDWYNTGLKRETPVEELQQRRKIIDGYMKDTDVDFWLGLLKIYLGINTQNSAEYISLVDKFKSNDEFFSVTNTNLLRLLAGCSIAEKIEENASYLSDMLALGICIHLGQQIEILPQLTPLAEEFWISKSENGREMTTKLAPKKLTQSFAKVTMTAGTESPEATTVADETIKNLGLVLKDTNNLLVHANILFDLISELQTNQKYLSEESNVLWWIFGGYSEIVNRKFSVIAPKLSAVIIPLELNNLTVNLPGLGKIDNFVTKIFELNKAKKEGGTLENIITSIANDTEAIQKALPIIDPAVIDLCPILNAAHCFTEFSVNEWKSVYERRGGINTEIQLELSLISNQIYKELMLIRVLKNLRN